MKKDTERHAGRSPRALRLFRALACLLALALLPAPAAAQEEAGIVVGRVYHVEGELLRYVPEEKDWVAVVQDAPFAADDTLFTGSRGLAELIVPNGAWLRLGNMTEVRFTALGGDTAEVGVASGVVRFLNGGSRTLIRAGTAVGYVLAGAETVFDLYVGDTSVECVAVRGNVTFVHEATGTRYDVTPAGPSILADRETVSSGDGRVDPDWDLWNGARDDLWSAMAGVRGKSAEYLPPDLQYENYALEANGVWEPVFYEGADRWCWRPLFVPAGWTPFSVGRWTYWHGDQTWIPGEPFGYVTHHYGNWIFVRNLWYWAPPVVRHHPGLPLLDIGFFWFPGRVCWIYRAGYVGWFPLAPREPYFSHRRWGGRHTFLIGSAAAARHRLNLRSYAHVGQSIVVPRKYYYGTVSYSRVRLSAVKPATIVNSYRPAAVVDSQVIGSVAKDPRRFNFADVGVREKPHRTVTDRIRRSRAASATAAGANAAVLRERAARLPEGRIRGGARVEEPRLTNSFVPAAQVNRPRSGWKPERRVIKGSERIPSPPPPVPGDTGAPTLTTPAERPGRSPAPVMRPVQPEVPRIPAATPKRPEPAERRGPETAPPVRVTPGQRAPDAQEVPTGPARQAPAQRDRTRRERPAPVKRGEPLEIVVPPSRPRQAAPTRPAPHERTRREGVAPVRPGRAVQPAGPAGGGAERMRPARPATPAAPTPPASVTRPVPERAAPARSRPKAAAPAKPARPEQVRPARPPAPREQVPERFREPGEGDRGRPRRGD